MLPNGVVGVVDRAERFERARCIDWCALEAHCFAETLDKDAAIKGVGEEFGVDEWRRGWVARLERDCAS
jgi:hypothetical protein